MDQSTAELPGRTLHDTTHNRLKAVDLPRLKPGYHHDGGGLYLDVRSGERGGARVWVYRYMRHGKARTMGLGPLHTISLKDARRKATEARKLLLEGTDALAAKEAHRAAQRVSAATSMTFQQAAEAYIDAHTAGWRGDDSQRQWEQSLRDYAYPVLGSLPVAAIDTALVMQVIEPIWSKVPETASRVRRRIESVLDWATARGYREGENPARWKGHLENLLPARAKVRRVEHFPALPYVELPALMVELRQQEGIAARALEFTILTAARTEQVTGARWSEINLAERVWIVPGERMKSGREHRVPLSDAAMAIIEKMAAIRQSDFVFPGTRPGRPIGENAMFHLLRRMKGGDLTVHGFRSTFMDWAMERTGYPAEMRDLALAHVVSDKVEAAYRRGDMVERRREMMAAWAQFAAAEDAGDKVVKLPVQR
jgi:integrase